MVTAYLKNFTTFKSKIVLEMERELDFTILSYLIYPLESSQFTTNCTRFDFSVEFNELNVYTHCPLIKGSNIHFDQRAINRIARLISYLNLIIFEIQ